MMNVISVIVGSVRQRRFAAKPARWVFDRLKKRQDIDARLLDLNDYSMPFFDAPIPPATPGRPAYEHEVVRRWTRAIAVSDGFIMVAPEYNHGCSAVLKNAIDWVYPEWNRKPVTFVGYGSVGGARAIEQLREIAVEVQLAPIRSAVHVPVPALYAHFQDQDVAAHLSDLDGALEQTIDDLLWWTQALKVAREQT